MNVRHSDIKIPEDGTDSFVNCKLDRRKYADVLTSIVSNYNNGFVLAIDNKWGTGKTTFVKMWRQQLINQQFKTLYFNAWENDFQEEVIIALLSELEEFRDKGEKTFMTLVEKSATFLKKVFPAVVKGVAGKAIGDDSVTEVVGAVSEFTAEEVELQIKNYNEKKKGINDFRKALKQFVDNVDEDKPVVFIIDELDRCRPRYAVEVLEQIKHLFSVPGIVFVLSIDKVQLGNAVKGFYGSDLIDADDYLRRFIDLGYSIPEPNKRLMVNYLYQYFDYDQFFKNPDRHRQFISDEVNFKNFATAITSNSNFSLRKVEKLFSLARVALKTINLRNYVYPDLFLILTFLKIQEESVFNGINGKKYTVQELITLVESLIVNDKKPDDNLLFVYGIISLALSYHNYYYEDIYPKPPFDVEKDERGDIISINYKSKFAEVNNRSHMVNAYVTLRNKVQLTAFSVKPILERILLLNPILD